MQEPSRRPANPTSHALEPLCSSWVVHRAVTAFQKWNDYNGNGLLRGHLMVEFGCLNRFLRSLRFRLRQGYGGQAGRNDGNLAKLAKCGSKYRTSIRRRPQGASPHGTSAGGG